MGLDLEQLLAPISDDRPCGDNLAYDPAYLALDSYLTPSEGGMVAEAEASDPDWRSLNDASLDLLTRTKDLQLIIHVVVSELALNGLPGMAEAIALLRQALERHWEQLHPQLDPEDDNDPTQRVNIIAAISSPAAFGDPIRFLSRLNACPIVTSRRFGPVSLRTMQQVRGEVAVAEDETKLELADVEAVLRDVSESQLREACDAATQAAQDVAAIDQFLTEKLGHAEAPDLSELRKRLQEVQKLIGPYLAEGASDEQDSSAADAAEPSPDGPAAGAAPSAGQARGLNGEVRSTQDVLRAIDRICEFYAKQEPSSPVPLLLNRARKLVGRNFLDIVEDLAPDASSAMRDLGGLDGDNGEPDD